MATTFPLDTPMLPPLVLRPPLSARILRVLVLVLAAIFHVVPAGWSLILNGTEGDLASTARVLLHERSWLSAPMADPLTVWLSKISMGFLGVNEFAARLPVALAVIVMVWFTMGLAERFGGIWRGFVAGMILLCSPGIFTLARLLTPVPVGTAFVTAAFFCLVSGSKRRPGRRQWYALAWAALICAAFSGGWNLAVVPLVAIGLLLPFYREARIRFRALISWEGAAAVAVVAAGAHCSWHAIPTLIPHWDRAGWWSAGWLPAMLFPWSLLLLPAAWSVGRRLLEGAGVDWPEAIPLAWMVAGMAMAALFPPGAVLFSVVIWPAFAIWAALRLETLPRSSLLRVLIGMLGVAAVGLVAATQLRVLLPLVCPARAELFSGIPASFWPSVTSVAFIALLAFALLGVMAFGMEWQNRRRFTVLALCGAMIPAGYAFADISAKFAPYFSYADFARCIDGDRHESCSVWATSESPATSLHFYFHDPLQPVAEVFDLSIPGGSKHQRGFLITRRTHLALWNGHLRGRFRIVCESGDNVLLTSP